MSVAPFAPRRRSGFRVLAQVRGFQRGFDLSTDFTQENQSLIHRNLIADGQIPVAGITAPGKPVLVASMDLTIRSDTRRSPRGTIPAEPLFGACHNRDGCRKAGRRKRFSRTADTARISRARADHESPSGPEWWRRFLGTEANWTARPSGRLVQGGVRDVSLAGTMRRPRLSTWRLI